MADGYPDEGATTRFGCSGRGHACDVHDDASRVHGDRPGLRLRRVAVVGELRGIRAVVHRWAEQNALPPDTEMDLQLALGEAVSNGMEHAYPDGEPGTVDVELEIRPPDHAADGTAVVAVRVVDHGTWRPPPEQPGYRGRGLTLIEGLASGLRVVGTACGTQVSFEIPLR